MDRETVGSASEANHEYMEKLCEKVYSDEGLVQECDKDPGLENIITRSAYLPFFKKQIENYPLVFRCVCDLLYSKVPRQDPKGWLDAVRSRVAKLRPDPRKNCILVSDIPTTCLDPQDIPKSLLVLAQMFREKDFNSPPPILTEELLNSPESSDCRRDLAKADVVIYGTLKKDSIKEDLEGIINCLTENQELMVVPLRSPEETERPPRPFENLKYFFDLLGGYENCPLTKSKIIWGVFYL